MTEIPQQQPAEAKQTFWSLAEPGPNANKLGKVHLPPLSSRPARPKPAEPSSGENEKEASHPAHTLIDLFIGGFKRTRRE